MVPVNHIRLVLSQPEILDMVLANHTLHSFLLDNNLVSADKKPKIVDVCQQLAKTPLDMTKCCFKSEQKPQPSTSTTDHILRKIQGNNKNKGAGKRSVRYNSIGSFAMAFITYYDNDYDYYRINYDTHVNKHGIWHGKSRQKL